MKKNTISAFDFDHTLIDRDSLLPFLYYSSGVVKASFYLFLLMPAFMLFFLGVATRQATKEKILTRFFKGVPFDKLRAIGYQYAEEKLDRYIKPEALEKLQWHLEQGHCCILVSASFNFYLEAWAKRHGFEATLCSIPAIDKRGKVTGLLKGKNCWGPEKVHRLLDYLGPRENFLLYAYGDSLGDNEMLALADYPFFCCFT
ncbi:MAG: HAD-IB family hydrolase [Candidatus Protochlamydia sp.]|nr:HAD-IB family hydrolase [Candidatus Protochlamydia sp.]